ncbi:MAG TPA: NAD(P)/FAD-dependent oxidoreductase [Streptosporangiaceae bacterium]
MPTYDAIVVGAGPAGSVAALTLARSGARVALVDRRRFPRDKACGDLIGPRGVRLLSDLGIDIGSDRPLGDMIVIGPTGRRALLPALPGVDYAGHAIVVERQRFDRELRDAAVAAGAEPVHGRVTALRADPSGATGVDLAGGTFLAGAVIIGADGANSRVAAQAGLVDASCALWGFAVRGYVEAEVALPHIVLWEPRPWRLFPGYGWAFPTEGGGVNVGLGLAFGWSDRTTSRQAMERFGDFLTHLTGLGVWRGPGGAPGRAPGGDLAGCLGGWLKMGMVGTVPAAGRVLLAGDAAGMVNPLQGEGIAQAMATGHAAAAAVVAAGPGGAAAHYLRLLRPHARHHRLNAPLHAGMVAHPRAVSLAGRVLTAPGVRGAISGAWGLYWNDLVHGALPSRHRTISALISRGVAVTVARNRATAWFAEQLGETRGIPTRRDSELT